MLDVIFSLSGGAKIRMGGSNAPLCTLDDMAQFPRIVRLDKRTGFKCSMSREAAIGLWESYVPTLVYKRAPVQAIPNLRLH